MSFVKGGLRGSDWLHPEGGGKTYETGPGTAYPKGVTPYWHPDWEKREVDFMPVGKLWPYREFTRVVSPAFVETLRASGGLVTDPLQFTYYSQTGQLIIGEGNHRLAALRRLFGDDLLVPVRVSTYSRTVYHPRRPSRETDVPDWWAAASTGRPALIAPLRPERAYKPSDLFPEGEYVTWEQMHARKSLSMRDYGLSGLSGLLGARGGIVSRWWDGRSVEIAATRSSVALQRALEDPDEDGSSGFQR